MQMYIEVETEVSPFSLRKESSSDNNFKRLKELHLSTLFDGYLLLPSSPSPHNREEQVRVDRRVFVDYLFALQECAYGPATVLQAALVGSRLAEVALGKFY
jgi:hypothetical protein